MQKNLFVACLFLFCGLQGAAAQSEAAANGLVWHTDLMKAQQISNKTKKPIFGFFTGSDWCGWCTKLQRDVFAKPEFVKWANDKVVLLELDFPRRKTLPTELAQQNMGLQQAFGVRGYPTIWLFYLNDKGQGQGDITALGSLGYPSGAVVGEEQVKFLENAEAVLKSGKN
jgi:thioredoxin-related protein